MRTIKFRAWDKVQKIMLGNVATGCIEIWGDDDASATSADCDFMQFTGLKDKNGVEIYEGDIVNHQGEFAVIDWGNGGFVLSYFSSEGGEGSDYLNRFNMKIYKKITVLGNIYENKELLEDK